MAKRLKILKINEITTKLNLTQWVKRILPFIFPQGKFSDTISALLAVGSSGYHTTPTTASHLWRR
jgi:hypothetical protein